MGLPPIPDRVEAGVRLLDERIPGWEDRIDLDRLELASACRCVLGQLHLDQVSDPNLAYVQGKWSLYLGDDEAIAGGFNISDPNGEPGDLEFDLLTAAWRNRIEARRNTKAANQ